MLQQRGFAKRRLGGRWEARCVDTARRLSDGFRHSLPPFPLEPLLEHFEVREVRERALDRDACLYLDAGGLFVEVNSLYSLACRRAAIAHEIGHLIVDRCTPEKNSHWGCLNKGVEDLCDRLAAELLAPAWAVRRYLASERLGGRPHSSKRLTLRKAAAIFGVPAGILSLSALPEETQRFRAFGI